MASGGAREKENLIKTDEIKKGSIIKFKRPMYKHFAVYIGNDTIIHLTADTTTEISTCKSICAFSSGENKAKAEIKKQTLKGQFYVREDKKEDPKPQSPEQIVTSAERMVGEKGYSVFNNNCEHFARWCRFGISSSKQADKLKLVPEVFSEIPKNYKKLGVAFQHKK